METEISTRSRNLGYGFSTQPNGEGPFGVVPPAAPRVHGGLRSVEGEMNRVSRLFGGSGTEVRTRIFVGGRPVVAAHDGLGWIKRPPSGGLVERMREGETIRVRLGAPGE